MRFHHKIAAAGLKSHPECLRSASLHARVKRVKQNRRPGTAECEDESERPANHDHARPLLHETAKELADARIPAPALLYFQ
jgi:hypothetical protein